MQRRLSGVAPVSHLREVANPRTIPFGNLSGGPSRRTAPALHGPWPRLIERSGPQSPQTPSSVSEPSATGTTSGVTGSDFRETRKSGL